MGLKERIAEVEAKIADAAATTMDEVERFRVDLLGRNGKLAELFEDFKSVGAEEKRAFGQRINKLKHEAQARWEDLKNGLARSASTELSDTDPTVPADTDYVGGLHPITIVRNKIVSVFARIGYTVSQGPEVEDDHHNFGALNFPPDHPARDMQDTFFVDHERRAWTSRGSPRSRSTCRRPTSRSCSTFLRTCRLTGRRSTATSTSATWHCARTPAVYKCA